MKDGETFQIGEVIFEASGRTDDGVIAYARSVHDERKSPTTYAVKWLDIGECLMADGVTTKSERGFRRPKEFASYADLAAHLQKIFDVCIAGFGTKKASE